jgi:uncharacterized protein YdeI (YjbR/CyaY-like superfamily)
MTGTDKGKGIRTENFQKVEVQSAEELVEWLASHHPQAESVWLVTYKKSEPDRYVSRDEVLDALIAFGWIDGIRRKLDEERTMQLISPRKQQAWTQTYKDRADRLKRLGRMRSPGLAAIARSKGAGQWNASAPVDALIIPEDLAHALAADPEAEDFFRNTAPSYQRNVLRWIANAKRAETRAKRIAQTVAQSAARKKVPQF